MLKKKVMVKSKKSPAETLPSASSKSSLGRTITHAPPAPSAPTARVYTLSKSSELPKKSTYIVNNMVKLNINLADIIRLEKELEHGGLLHGIELSTAAPVAWNDNCGSPLSPVSKEETETESGSETRSRPFKTLIKKPILNMTVESDTAAARKDLIINSGVKRSSKPIMQVYAHGWPAHSSYACWYCCHTFNTTPVGIPQLLINMVFHCYGNFCSYNCAKRYLRPETEDDMAMLQTANDTFIEDDLGERMQLLELLCHIETGSPLDQPIKAAPRRLTLNMFGGTKTIEEFRANFLTNDSYHVFQSPLVPISYQMEECNDKTDRKRRQRVSLDTVKIERAFSELAEKAKQHKTSSLSKRMIRT